MNKGTHKPYRVEWEMFQLEYIHRNVDNDPSEPYRGISSIFNADAYAQGLRDREAWMVVSSYLLEHLSEEKLEVLGLD